MFKHEKGYSYSNKPSITSVMHFKDIQKVILRGRVVRWCWVNFQCRGVLQFG